MKRDRIELLDRRVAIVRNHVRTGREEVIPT
jgi:hypothetical protein